ncbi:hypothetical protein [Pseudoponticoccus marisrubri]|uniref:Uracil-DNA glycosylase-like domain-containing protein n=1 Tax=Pseudoponticoccus marisrubri TaxID=1685382 RepID=A0A0W7WQ18_9RHOB|nr:hypothetical protein [Pseudoponticoccus marisrubri]KUF12665.1 hypothetical protein AVJ23_02810 [Pseudoponticoccus marisrubri]
MSDGACISAATLYRDAVARRRAFRLPGYPTLAEAGFDGDYVSPIQMSSGNLTGPMLISKDWLDAPSAARHHAQLSRTGYLPDNPFNRVIDKVLAMLGLARADIYITPVFHLLVSKRSSTIPPAHARACFKAVGQYELLGRRPVALGTDSARVLRAFGIDHVPAPHPSARIGSFDLRASRIADAVARA